MYPLPLQKLIELFGKLPGIGPRQAARFAFFVLKGKDAYVQELIASLEEVSSKIKTCAQCYRTVEDTGTGQILCAFCKDTRRDHAMLAIVEKEADMQNLEKTGAFRGLYHILGGVISPLDQDSPRRLHLRQLHERIKGLLASGDAAFEVVLATSSTTEGDTTALYIEQILAPLRTAHPQLKISRLGRGLSLGSELEYADEITLRNALTNRR